MQIVHNKNFPEIVRYQDIDLGCTFMPIHANEGMCGYMSIQETVDPDNHNIIYNAVCLSNALLRYFDNNEKVVYVEGSFVVCNYNAQEIG